MSFWLNDLAALFVETGVDVQLATGCSVRGLFDDEYVGVEDSIEIESSGPAVTCRTSDVSGVAHGDTLNIEGTTYTVRGIRPDGKGITVLRLETV